MKAIGIILLSIGVAASVIGCAPHPVNTADPLQVYNATRNFQSFEERDKGLKERWLAQGS